jgi:hypothetical protein
MVELLAMLLPVVVGIIVQLLDRPAKPVEVGGGAGHRDGIRRVLDRMRQAASRGSVG